MKKYLSMTLVLLLALSVGVMSAGAEEMKVDASSNVRVNARVNAEVKANAMIDADLKAKREAARNEISQMRVETKNEMEARRLAAKQKFEMLRTQIAGDKDAARAKLKEARLFTRESALKKFDGAIERMTHLKDKIKDHILKFEERGVDVEEALRFIAIAEEKLELASDKTVEINALLSVSVEALSDADKAKLRTLISEVQTLIREVHQALRDAVRELREAVVLSAQARAEAEVEHEEDEEN